MAARINNRTPARIAAPIASAVLLIALAGVGTLRPATPSGAADYFLTIAEAIDDTPYRINAYTGRDLTQPPTEAVDMLRPTRVLHRGYRHDGFRDDVRVVIVHCPDVRDMAGHHPPNCYPATGWTTTDRTTLPIAAFGADQTLAVHRFSRRDGGIAKRITVASGFIVPGQDGTMLTTMDQLRDAAENRRRTRLGAAQVQIIIDRDADQEDLRRAAQAFLPALGPVFDRVTEGIE
ncbi:MAG: exosortase-associated EpsI family protein [Planctomycetota bacterium]